MLQLGKDSKDDQYFSLTCIITIKVKLEMKNCVWHHKGRHNERDIYALDLLLHLKTCHAEMYVLTFDPTAKHAPYWGPDPWSQSPLKLTAVTHLNQMSDHEWHLLLSSSLELRVNFQWSLWVCWNKRASSKAASKSSTHSRSREWVAAQSKSRASLLTSLLTVWHLWALLYAFNASTPQFTHLWKSNNTYKLHVLWGYSIVMHLQITTWKCVLISATALLHGWAGIWAILTQLWVQCNFPSLFFIFHTAEIDDNFYILHISNF